MLKNSDNLVIVGAMANNFLKLKGINVGASLIEKGSENSIKNINVLAKKNKCNILIDEDEEIELIRENDILNGFGFKSDCEMKVWHINKPSGIIEKGVDK